MKLPFSFEEVAYFNNEYRGDLIVTKGVLYYFPHTRVVANRFSDEIGGREAMQVFNILANFVPAFGMIPLIRATADKSVKVGKFLQRTFRPTTNSPKIRTLRLWRGNETSENLQKDLDGYIEMLKKAPLQFERDSVPKPMRFAAAEMQNVSFGLKFKFDAKFDNHDFRVNLIHRNIFKKVLHEGGFLK